MVSKSATVLLMFMITLTSCAIPGKAPEREDEHIAYLQLTDGYWQIWLMEPDGSKTRQVTYDPVDKISLSFGKEGGEILYNTNLGDLYIVQVKNGRRRKLNLPISGMTDGDWSPDGREIVFSVNTVGGIDSNDIWIVNVDGSNLRKLTRMRGLQHDPVWCSGGSHILFLSGEGKHNHDIFLTDREGKNFRQLTGDGLYNFEPSCSSRGKIAFSSNRSGNYEIWVMDEEGDKVRQLTDHPGFDSSPSWSPDGRHLVFVSDRSGCLEVWRTGDKGTGLRQLTTSRTGCRSPAWGAK
jgi:TolB protein